MNDETLAGIAEKSAQDLQNLINEASENIVVAIGQCALEAQLQETKPKFTLSFSIAIEPDKGGFETKLSWTVKKTLSVDHSPEDPNQDKLPLSNTEAAKNRAVKKFADIVKNAGTTVEMHVKE